MGAPLAGAQETPPGTVWFEAGCGERSVAGLRSIGLRHAGDEPADGFTYTEWELVVTSAAGVDAVTRLGSLGVRGFVTPDLPGGAALIGVTTGAGRGTNVYEGAVQLYGVTPTGALAPVLHFVTEEPGLGPVGCTSLERWSIAWRLGDADGNGLVDLELDPDTVLTLAVFPHVCPVSRWEWSADDGRFLPAPRTAELTVAQLTREVVTELKSGETAGGLPPRPLPPHRDAIESAVPQDADDRDWARAAHRAYPLLSRSPAAWVWRRETPAAGGLALEGHQWLRFDPMECSPLYRLTVCCWRNPQGRWFVLRGRMDSIQRRLADVVRLLTNDGHTGYGCTLDDLWLLATTPAESVGLLIDELARGGDDHHLRPCLDALEELSGQRFSAVPTRVPPRLRDWAGNMPFFCERMCGVVCHPAPYDVQQKIVAQWRAWADAHGEALDRSATRPIGESPMRGFTYRSGQIRPY